MKADVTPTDILDLEDTVEALYRHGENKLAVTVGALALRFRGQLELQRMGEVAERMFSVRVPAPVALRLVTSPSSSPEPGRSSLSPSRLTPSENA